MLSEWLYGGTLETWAILLEIVLAGLIVVGSGSKLSILADKVADKYGLGGAWVGALLLATVTSLPEVVSGCTAVAIGQPDMAFAAIYGSCSFNIVLIVLFNALIGGGSILHGKGRNHALSSSFGIVLITTSLGCIVLVDKFAGQQNVVGTIELVVAVLIALVYPTCMRMVFKTEKELALESDPIIPIASTERLIPKVVIFSVILVASAWWMARTGDVLADHHIELIGGPLGATFVGVLFLAIATSLPEIVTGLAAVRLGNLDMALGNIFGSNMFNIFVFPMLKVTSLVSGQETLMGEGNFDFTRNLFAGMLPILLTAVVVGGLSYRTKRTFLRRIGVDSGLIAAIYIIGMIMLLSS